MFGKALSDFNFRGCVESFWRQPQLSSDGSLNLWSSDGIFSNRWSKWNLGYFLSKHLNKCIVPKRSKKLDKSFKNFEKSCISYFVFKTNSKWDLILQTANNLRKKSVKVGSRSVQMPSMNVDLMGVATFEIITLDTLPMVWGYWWSGRGSHVLFHSSKNWVTAHFRCTLHPCPCFDEQFLFLSTQNAYPDHLQRGKNRKFSRCVESF